jgi:hypothetical protein
MGSNHPRKMFVNLPVRDLKKSMAFFAALGFEFNPQFTDEKAACMIHVRVVLLRPRWASLGGSVDGSKGRATVSGSGDRVNDTRTSGCAACWRGRRVERPRTNEPGHERTSLLLEHR